MEELREQIKRRISIIDKDGKEWYDTMILLMFIERYFTALVGNKVLVIKSEWVAWDRAALVTGVLGEDEDYVDWDEVWRCGRENLDYLSFEGFNDIELSHKRVLTAVDEVTLETHLDLLLSMDRLKNNSLRDFLEEYIPVSQRLYIHRDEEDDINEAIVSPYIIQYADKKKPWNDIGIYMEIYSVNCWKLFKLIY